MIIDKSNGRLDEIKTFAKENNMLENFNNTFSRLENYLAKGYQAILFQIFFTVYNSLCSKGHKIEV